MKARDETLVAARSSADQEAQTLRNYAGGGWRDAAAPGTLEDVDPATGEPTSLVPLSGAADVDAAVAAARDAQPEWRAVAPQRRARAVMALREALWDQRDDLARLVTEDMGRRSTTRVVRWFGGSSPPRRPARSPIC